MNDKVKDLLKTTADEHSIKEALEADGLQSISFQLSNMVLNGNFAG
ncbi:hypothetical protein MLC44_07535 [Sulfurimonas sp. NW9]